MTLEYEEDLSIMVRAGYMTAAEMVDSIAQTDEDDRPSINTLSALVKAMLEERRSELGVSGSQSYERLRTAFETLDERGVLARENYWCCQTCAYTSMDEEVGEHVAAGEEVRGFVLFHSQDTERAVETGELVLRYGGLAPGSRRIGADASKAIGEEVVAVLQAAGFEPRWSGSPSDLIDLPIEWDKLPPDDDAAPTEFRVVNDQLH